METDKVTQQGVPDGEGEPESVFVITVFTFPLSFTSLLGIVCVVSVLLSTASTPLQPLAAKMQTNWDALLMPIFQLGLSSWSAIVPRSDLKSNIA